MQIRQLEHTRGVRLFDRNRRRVALTRVAKSLLEPIERITSDVDLLVTWTNEVARAVRGSVAIAALPSATGSFVPLAIAQFNKSHPGITICVQDVVAEKIVDLVEANEVDFGIGSLVSKRAGVIARSLMVDALHAFMPAGHPLADRHSLSLKEIVHEPIIITAKESSVRKLFEQALARANLKLVPAFETNQMSTALAFARAGLGLAILPYCAAEPSRENALCRIPLRGSGVKRQISIITKSGNTLTPAAMEFVALLLREFVSSRTK